MFKTEKDISQLAAVTQMEEKTGGKEKQHNPTQTSIKPITLHVINIPIK